MHVKNNKKEKKWPLCHKRKFVTKLFFQIIVECSSKNLVKIMSADVKATIKQYEIKYLVEFELT